MGLLVEGRWQDQWYDTKKTGGAFVRQESAFRDRVTRDGSSGFKAARGRYHLYVSLACPWAHRTLVMRCLKRLDDAIGVTSVEPLMLENGWSFGATREPLYGKRHLHEIYTLAKPNYTGRVTVPVLWDTERRTIVNNESAEIIRILDREFADFADVRHDYCPPSLEAEIDAVNARIYEGINNGVYRAGFATTQEAYEAATRKLFATLDWAEARLAERRWLVGDAMTEADIRLFTTLVRFDAVYYGHFKCNLRHVYEYPALWGYAREIYQLPGIATTVSFDHIKRHYYGSHARINPSGIVPLGPILDWTAPHGRDGAGATRR
jgi:putative glutathione S-transferase